MAREGKKMWRGGKGELRQGVSDIGVTRRKRERARAREKDRRNQRGSGRRERGGETARQIGRLAGGRCRGNRQTFMIHGLEAGDKWWLVESLQGVREEGKDWIQ